MSRRRFLDQLGRRAAALALGSLFAAPGARSQRNAEPPSGVYPFTLGVASGMPRPDAIALWTRLAPLPHAPRGGMPDAPAAVGWELATDEAFRHVVRSGSLQALPRHAHSVHVDVAGLPSATTFHYRFTTRDATSPVGRTRTAPALDAEPASLRLALASCQHYEQGWYAAHREIAARDLDLVLFVGDYIYESSNARYRVRPHEGPIPVTLERYRARHATYKLDPDLRAAHAAHPWIVTWDDHEVENDYANDRSPSGFEPAEFLRRRAAAYKAYFEHMPVSAAMAPQGAAMRIHGRYAWGRLADLWTLDNRQYRDAQPCSEPPVARGRVVAGCADLDEVPRSLFGAAQEHWLAQGLAASAARWRIVAQGSQLAPGGIDTPLGRRIYTDGWDGYPQARERLLRAIADAGAANVVCLGGDVHRHVAAQLRLRPNDERSPVVASEFVTSSITSHGVSEAVMAMLLRGNPDLVHGRADERGYAAITVTPGAMQCDFRGTPFPARADATLASQASFAVEQGVAGVVRA